MSDRADPQREWGWRLRYLARLWSLPSLAYLCGMIAVAVGIEYLGADVALPPAKWVSVALYPFGVLAGLVLAYPSYRWGGTVATACLVAFYVWETVALGNVPRGVSFLLAAAPGPLYLLAWWLLRPRA